MSQTAKALILIFAVACPAGLAAQTYPPVPSRYTPVGPPYGHRVVAPVHYETPVAHGVGVVAASYDSPPIQVGERATAGLSGSPGNTVGQANRGTRQFQRNEPPGTSSHGIAPGGTGVSPVHGLDARRTPPHTAPTALPSPLPRRESSRPLPPRDQPTKSESTDQSRGIPSLTTLAGSLGIVLGIFFGLAWMMRRLTPQGLSVLPGEVFEVLGRAPLAGRQQAHLLRCGNKLLLVSVTPTGAETLSEVTDPDEVERMTAMCRRPVGKATETLRQVLGQLAQSQPSDAEPHHTPVAGGSERRHA